MSESAVGIAGLRAVAESPVVLIASDFDGTLAALVDRPEDARVDERAWTALIGLAALPHTHAAVITGRARSDVRRRLPGAGPAGITVIGSHGLEHSENELTLDADAKVRLEAVLDMLYAEAMQLPNAQVEVKPASATFHVRRCDRAAGEAALSRLRSYAAGMEGVTPLEGHRVLEFAVVKGDKGAALARLKYECGAAAVCFIGDDATDENAFAVLGGRDLGVKIGPEATLANTRIATQADVAAVLEELLERRRAFLEVRERTMTPIERHSLLSDQRALALVDDRGTIVWACMPRIDSAPLFARLVGDGGQGEFSIEPSGVTASTRPAQRYEGESMVLQTIWPEGGEPRGAAGGAGARLMVTDYMDVSGGRAFQRAGRVEMIRVIEGRGRARVRFAPRLDFGRSVTTLRPVADGLEVEGWYDPIVLRSPGVRWQVVQEGPHHTAEAEIDLSFGPVTLELRYGTSSMLAAPAKEAIRREQSRRFWSGWAATLRSTTMHAALVRRSALALKALVHGPTGAIAAAATTSLPEHLGGVRNWDYRYCWVRDACLAASALVRLGNTGVGLKLLDWTAPVVAACESPDRLRPLYTVSGERLGPEAEISEAGGYGGSRPVRIGNAASQQVQLDVFGPVVELVALLAGEGAPITPEQWRLVEAMVNAVNARWREPDHGIWEIRGPKRHHVHTKVMCWFAVDRGLTVATQAMGKSRPGWEELHREIADDILSNGVDVRRGCFTAAYGESVLDAAALWVGLSGLVPARDPRFVATVEAIERELLSGPAVYRYLVDDGLPGREGAWLICATWLVESLALIGRVDDAKALLARVASLAGPTGLMAEEYDPRYGIALGNFPQAYSHLGFINAVLRLESLTETRPS